MEEVEMGRACRAHSDGKRRRKKTTSKTWTYVGGLILRWILEG
jgi:hypothetical protein